MPTAPAAETLGTGLHELPRRHCTLRHPGCDEELSGSCEPMGTGLRTRCLLPPGRAATAPPAGPAACPSSSLGMHHGPGAPERVWAALRDPSRPTAGLEGLVAFGVLSALQPCALVGGGAGRGPRFPCSRFPPHPRNCSPSGPRRTCRRWRERGRCHTSPVCVPGGRVLSTAALPAPRNPQQFACRARCLEGSHRLQPARQVQGQDGSHTAARGTLSRRRNGSGRPAPAPPLPPALPGLGIPGPDPDRGSGKRRPSASPRAPSLFLVGFASPVTSGAPQSQDEGKCEWRGRKAAREQARGRGRPALGRELLPRAARTSGSSLCSRSVGR